MHVLIRFMTQGRGEINSYFGIPGVRSGQITLSANLSAIDASEAARAAAPIRQGSTATAVYWQRTARPRISE